MIFWMCLNMDISLLASDGFPGTEKENWLKLKLHSNNFEVCIYHKKKKKHKVPHFPTVFKQMLYSHKTQKQSMLSLK